MKTMGPFIKVILGALLCLSLSACFIRPYKFDITQGNPLTADKVAEIHPGMSAEQVRYTLGTPMLQDVFHDERWDYVYYDKPGYKAAKRSHMAIYFEDGRVARITKDAFPDAVV